MKQLFWIFVLAAATCFTSCVCKKKYLIAENGRIASLEREEALRSQLKTCNENGDLLSERIENLSNDTAELGGKLQVYRKLLFSNKSEQEKLSALLDEKSRELEERENTIRELEELTRAQKETVSGLLANEQDALMGFGSDELRVTQHDGKVYVAMSDKLLFESGSARVDKRGKEALAKLAEVLNKQTDIDVFIEGHTDTQPIHTAQFKDNWDLSVLRATSVVRILTEEYQVKPLQIQPTGRGEFMPVADNESAEGRSLNRRTEIIMAPKLDKLMQLLQHP